ncbi:MAG: DUF1761 domain-containing protein [Verrucomicrobiota bacterium]|nr:DUF1761 domain-containing protein [Verrucomicrobiota bacterium]
MNWLAILCAGAAYWVLGYVWYSLLFGKLWCAELIKHRGERPSPSGGEMAGKLISTFVSNLVAAAAMAYLFKRTGITDMSHALRLAAAAGIGFAGTAVTIVSIWESKPTTIWFIDVGYYFVGALLMAIIFVSWP